MLRLLLLACTIPGITLPCDLPANVKSQSLSASLSLFSNHSLLQCLPSLGLNYTFAGYSVVPLLMIGVLYALSFAVIYKNSDSNPSKSKYFDLMATFSATFATLFFSKLGISFVKYFITLISMVGYVLFITKMNQQRDGFRKFMNLEIALALGYLGFMLLVVLGWIPAMLFGFMTYIVGFFLAILAIFGLHIQISLNLYQFVAVLLFIFHTAKVIYISNQSEIFADIKFAVIKICETIYAKI